MKRLSVVSVFCLLFFANEARAQFYVQTVTPGPYLPLASLPGAQNVTPFSFSSTDEGNATVPIPFIFNYLGQPYTEARVAVNGYVVFGQNTDFGSYSNYPIGSPSGADNVIAVWWDDLVVPLVDGYASYGTLGSAPNRVFVIEVRGWEHYAFGNVADGNWQVWLYEGVAGRFEVRVDGELDAAEGYSATTGWEGPDGVPSGAFLACSNGSPYCNHLDYAGMTGNVYAVQLAQGPELQGSVGMFPRGALPGQSAVGQVTLRNVGTQSASNVQSSLYLSADAQVDASDLLVGTFTVPQLLAGNVPTTLTATVSVPPGAPPGNYTLLLFVDSNNAVNEVAETNNVSAAAAPFATARNLTAAGALAVNGANPGGTLSVDIGIGNVGVAYAGPVTVRIYGSTNRTYEAQDPVLGTATINLTGAATETFSIPVTVPSIPTGSYYPVLRVDPNNAIVEYDENDNLAVGAQAFPVGPELGISQLVSPGGANPGQPIAFMVTIVNTGVAYSGSLQVRFVASPDPIYDVNDPVLGLASITLTGLPSETLPATLTMPAIPSGLYYPIAIADPNNLIPEVNDFNNTRVGTTVFASGPDLRIDDVAGPTQATPGQPMMVTTTVGSSGAPYTGQVAYRLFLSADRAFDPQDTMVGEYTVSFTGQAAVADARMPLFPASLPPTGHYLIAVVDPQSQVAEASEANNVFIDDQRIGSGTDLRVYGVDFDASSARPGDQVHVTFTLSAEGSPFFGTVGFAISLSRDSSPDPGDLRVLDGTIAIAGTVTNAVTATITIGAQVPPGSYELIVEADPANQIVEPSETNNWDDSFFDLDIEGPNLAVTSLSAGAQAFVGIPFPVQLVVSNTDVVDAAGFRYGYYFTTNGLLRPPDGTELFVATTGPIPAGQSRVLTDMIDLPPQAVPSRYVQLGVILDVDAAVSESDEGDNISFLPGQLQILLPVADLWARIDEAPLEVAAGEDLAVTRTLQNLGVADSPPFTYGYYLSANDEIAPADDLLIASLSAQLQIGDYDRSIDIVNLPATVPPGVYRLGLVADPGDQLLETDESNNVALGPEVRVFPAALSVYTDQLPAAVLGAPYSAQLFASGPAANRTWTVTSGALPPGLALDQLAGTIMGTATEDGLYPFIVRVSAGNAHAERGLALRVRGGTVPIEIVTRMLPYAIVGRPYQTELVAVGGATPYTFGVRSALPEGLTATSTGGIGGTPTQAGAYALAVVVTDAEGSAATADVALNVVSPDRTVAITQAPLPDATFGAEYCQPETIKLYASGGLPPYVWTALSGPPPGMTLSSAGSLCGAPSSTGDFPMLVRAQDGTGVFDTSLFILRVRDASELSISLTTLQDAVRGEPYAAKLTARQGVEPYRWTIDSGALPGGLELSEEGTISGTPSALETAVFAVQVTDGAMQSRLQPLSIRVVEPGGGSSCGCTEAEPRSGAGPWLQLVLISLALAWRSRRFRRA